MREPPGIEAVVIVVFVAGTALLPVRAAAVFGASLTTAHAIAPGVPSPRALSEDIDVRGRKSA